MKICIVGGIFDKSEEYQSKHLYTPETNLANGLEREGYKVNRIGLRQFHYKEEFNVIHIHHVSTAALEMASVNSKAAFVFTSHNGQIICGYEKSLFKVLAYRYILGYSDGIVALSNYEANSIARLGIPYEKISVIPNGMPTNIFYPTEPKTYGKKFRLLFVGQLIDLKGVDILLKAFCSVVSAFDAELILVYQSDHNENRYRELVSNLGIADKVHFVGFRSAAELAVLYREVDVLILPSFAEALPSVVTEALLSGVPVVASGIGGIPEQVGSCGVLTKPGDIEDLKRGIYEVLAHLEVYRQRVLSSLGERRNVYDIRKMVESHIALYNHLLSGAKRSSKPGFLFPTYRVVRKVKDLLWT